MNGSTNQMDPRLAGTGTGLSSNIINDTSSRLLMLGVMLSQSLVIKGSTERRVMTGAEPEYAKTTWKVEMPCDAKIIKVIEKFPRRIGAPHRINSESVVIFEDMEKKAQFKLELGCMVIKSHHSSHQSFGFAYQQCKTQSLLRPGAIIPKGTVFCKSPNVADNGNYKFSIEVPTALMSVPQIIEDGVVVSDELCRQMTTTIIEDRMGSWGKKAFPRNIYGNDKEYKPHPDQGEKIRDDGLLFALCEYQPMHGICEMDVYSLNDPEAYDPIFDDLMFADPNATVADITVIHNHRETNPPTPIGMDVQQRKYMAAQTRFNREILKITSDYKMKEKSTSLSLPLHLLAVEAIDNDPRIKSGINIGGGVPDLDPITKRLFDNIPEKVVRTYRANPIDDWTVKITYSKEIVPTVGFKITGLHGDKAVICEVRPAADMPRDQWGHTAHLITDSDSTIKRNNVGRVFSQYTSASARDCSEDIYKMVAEGRVADARAHYENYIRTVSPKQGEVLDKLHEAGKFEEHFEGVLAANKVAMPLTNVGEEGVNLWLPTNAPLHSAALIKTIKDKFPVRMGPVTYVGKSGKVRTTKTDVLIASVPILLLEKTGSDFAAVSTAKRNYLGVLSKLTNADKNSLPYREQPTRLLGEAEIRLIVAMVGPVVAQRLLEYPNSAKAQKIIARAIMMSQQPTNMDVIIDDKIYEPGNSAANNFVDMLHFCGGVKYAREEAKR